jgi:hypothetical protein
MDEILARLMTPGYAREQISAALAYVRAPGGSGEGFDASRDGFLASFAAALMALPFVAIQALASGAMMDAGAQLVPGRAYPAAITLGSVFAGLLAHAASWVAFPAIMVRVSAWLGRDQSYFRLISVWNWTGLLAAAALALAAMTVWVAGLSVALLLVFTVMAAIFVLRFMTARGVLGVRHLEAFGIAVLDLVLLLAIGQAGWWLTRVVS